MIKILFHTELDPSILTVVTTSKGFVLLQTTNKESGRDTNNTSTQKNKDTYNKDPFQSQVKNSGNGQAGQYNMPAKGKYSPDDKYNPVDPRNPGDRQSDDRNDRRYDRQLGSNEKDRSGYKSHGDGGGIKTSYDRNNEVSRRDKEERQGYRDTRGHGDTRGEDMSDAARKYGEQRGIFQHENSGDYPSGKLNNQTGVCSVDNTDRLNRNSLNVGNRKSLVGTGDSKEQHVTFLLDRNGTEASSGGGDKDGLKTSYSDNEWATLANEAHLEETRRQFMKQQSDETNELGRSQSNLLVHNLGNNIDDEINSKSVRGESRWDSKNLNNMTGEAYNEFLDKEVANHMNMYNTSPDFTSSNTYRSKSSSGNINEDKKYHNTINSGSNDKKPVDKMASKETSQDAVERNSRENIVNTRDKYQNSSDTNGDLNKNRKTSLDYNDTKTSLKNLDKDFETPRKNSNPNFFVPNKDENTKGKTKILTPMQYSNKISALLEQGAVSSDSKTNPTGFQSKMRSTWDKTPRHFKGILFVVLIFALFAFALERIVLHKKTK